MDNLQVLNRKLEAIAWGTFFVWWGITELFPALPKGSGAIGIGVILLGLNATRSLNGIPSSGFTTTLGILALVLAYWISRVDFCTCRSSCRSLASFSSYSV